MPTAAASTCEPGTAADGREHRFTELPAGLYGSIGGERGGLKGRVVITSKSACRTSTQLSLRVQPAPSIPYSKWDISLMIGVI